MLHDIVTKGSTDRSVAVKILDATTGAPKTDVVYNSAGIALWYRREGAAVVDITEATLASLTTAHADGGFLHERDGVYRLDLPDAAFATGANHVDFGGTVTGGVVIGGRVRLVDINIEAAAIPANVTQFGGTNGTFSGGRPEVNVNAIAANAITAAATAADFGTEVGTAVWATTTRTLTALDEDNTTMDLDATIRNAMGLASANLDTQLGAIAGYIDTEVGAIFNRIGAPVGASISADIAAVQADTDNIQTRLPAALVGGRIDASVGAMANNVMTAAAAAADLTTELQSGLATAADLAVVDGIVDAILVDTAEIGAAGAGLTALASAANLATLAGYVDTEVAAIKATTDKLDDTLEDSGGGNWVFTVAALDNAPSGGGGGGDATEAKQDQIIAALAVVDANVDSLVVSVADLPTNSELATALASSDDATLAAVASVQADTNDIQARLPAALVGGRMDSSTGAMAANVMTAAATAADFVAELSGGGGGDAPTAEENAAAVWGFEIENNFSARSSMRLQNAALFGQASGLETTEARYRDPNDTTDRIVATVDLDGNRTAVALDAG